MVHSHVPPKLAGLYVRRSMMTNIAIVMSVVALRNNFITPAVLFYKPRMLVCMIILAMKD
jgi:hypothetical protein